jgi:hypothetical protein
VSDWQKVGEWTPIDSPEYLFEVEEYRNGDKQMVFIHLHIWKWTISVLKRIRRDFNLFRQCVPCPIYTCGTADDDKFERFVSLFGWKPLTTIPCTDGKTRRLFIHINDNKNVLQIEREKRHQ